MFQPILEGSLPWCRGRWLAVAIDETRLNKTGRRVAGAGWQRDPLGPPFQINLQWACVSCRRPSCCRCIGVGKGGCGRCRFVSPPRRRRGDRKRRSCQRNGSSTARRRPSTASRPVFVEQAQGLRRDLDRAGARAKVLVLAADGSFCNRRVFGAAWDRTTIVARARKDAVLWFPAAAASRRFYAAETFTPEQVR